MLIPALLSVLLAAAAAPPHDVRFDDPASVADWRFTDADAWRVEDGALAQFAASVYAPPHRSPLNIAIMPLLVEGDFVLEVDLMQTGRDYAHRDLCLFFGVQSPERLLYAHLSRGADANAHHVHVVDAADRSPITSHRNDGVDWGRDAWRRVRLEVHGGTARVLFDGEEVLRADDLPWSDGYVGFGSFDDEGRADVVRLTAATVTRRIPPFWSPPTIPDEVRGDLLRLDDDGAWCWFQDERCIVSNGTLFVGSISSGGQDPARRGDVNVIVHDLASGQTDVVELHDRLQVDDHNNPGLLALPDGRVLALYTMHGNDALIRSRTTAAANDPRTWTDERREPIDVERYGVTYSNVFRLADANDGRGRIYDFFRGAGWDPNAIVSDDDGETWRLLGQLLGGPGRPYVRYVSNHRDTIHFVCTDQHPRDADNSIYHGFVRDDVIHASDGTPVGRLGETPAVIDTLTRVFAGDADNVAWCSNIELDDAGRPVIVYSVQKDSAGLPTGQGGEDCRYRYARWDGTAWHDHAVACAGQRLYSGEDDYTGLICVDPADASTVYFSTNADPVTGDPLISRGDGNRHHEIFRGRTDDGGVTWVFTAITRNSTVDNLRPMLPEGTERPLLLWLRGRYTTMHDFDQAVVGVWIEDDRPAHHDH